MGHTTQISVCKDFGRCCPPPVAHRSVGSEGIQRTGLDADSYYVEICRRVRLTVDNNRLHARAGGSKVARITRAPGGVTGDPWAPIVMDTDPEKVLTVRASGFGYRRMVRLMFDRASIRPAPLQEIAESDAPEGLSLMALSQTLA
jgi:CRISPR system Cascade subunit CasA